MVSVPTALLAYAALSLSHVNLPESISESGSKTCCIFISPHLLESSALTCRQKNSLEPKALLKYSHPSILLRTQSDSEVKDECTPEHLKKSAHYSHAFNRVQKPI